MATLVSGHGGTVVLGGTGVTLNTFIKSWTIEDNAEMLDISVMGTNIVARTFLKGLESSTVTIEFLADSGMALDTNSPGDAIASLTLAATGAAGVNNAHEYIMAAGIIESVNFTRDVDGLARWTMRVRGSLLATNITRPDGNESP